jgi:hypothetical protein
MIPPPTPIPPVPAVTPPREISAIRRNALVMCFLGHSGMPFFPTFGLSYVKLPELPEMQRGGMLYV